VKNKYYTPEIEEFHVGFEYEVKVPEGKCWSKEIFHLNELHIKLIKHVAIQDEFTHRAIRVKYLDKDDIESLGWSYDHDMKESDENIYNKDNWMMLHENGKISITYRDPCKNEEVMIKLRTTEVYNITIKNKSELKKLMKQLNI